MNLSISWVTPGDQEPYEIDVHQSYLLLYLTKGHYSISLTQINHGADLFPRHKYFVCDVQVLRSMAVILDRLAEEQLRLSIHYVFVHSQSIPNKQ